MKSFAARLFAFVATALLTFTPVVRGQTTPVVTTLYSFTGADGANPYAALVEGSDGNFYGTTLYGGGGRNGGAVFKMTQAGVVTPLHSFTGIGSDGAYPYAALVQGSDGNLYGTTADGGSSEAGTVFQITPAGVLTTLHSFTSADGGIEPTAALVLGRDGNFYGTTSQGYSSITGTIFKITPAGVLTTLHSFDGIGTDGSSPTSPLIQGQGRDDNFYGTTVSGGSGGEGTIFVMTPNGVVTLHEFTGAPTDGANPQGALVQGSDGNFYGTTFRGGSSSNGGTVFKMTPTGTVTTLHNFTVTGPDGASPYDTVVEGGDGNFYGTTANGGSTGGGTVFQITPDGSLTPIYGSFPTEASPEAALILATDGNFYGTTYFGGSANVGSIFQLSLKPNVTSATSVNADVGTGFSYQITETNGPTNFTALGLPAGLGVNAGTGMISGIPRTAGIYTVTLDATNAFGSGSATLTLTVTASTSVAVPTITNVTSTPAVVGETFSFAVTANSATSFAAVGLPPGLSLNSSVGLISGTPTQVGAYTISLSATNAGGTGTGSLVITVAAPPANISAVNILSPPTDISIVIGETIDLEVSVEAVNGTLANVDYAVYDATDTTLVTDLGDTAAARDHRTWMPATLGDFTLRVTATDRPAGKTVPSTIPIHVITSPSQPPTSVLLSGLDGKSFAAGTSVPLVALATDASGHPLSNVKFYLDGVLQPGAAASSASMARAGLHRQDASGLPFAQGYAKIGSILGDELLTITGTDNNGVTSVSPPATIHITAAPVAPSCNITSPAADSPLTPGTTVSASVTAAETGGSVSQVEFSMNGQNIVGTATVSPYTFSFTLPDMAGQYALTATATDANGVSATAAPVIISAVAVPPVVTISASGDGMAVEGGEKGKVVITRTGDTSTALTVNYKAKGPAMPGGGLQGIERERDSAGRSRHGQDQDQTHQRFARSRHLQDQTRAETGDGRQLRRRQLVQDQH